MNEFLKDFNNKELHVRYSAMTKIFLYLLSRAEQMFGERNKDWTFVGLEFLNDGPYIMYYGNKITIVLSNEAATDIYRFIFQVAHEVCHLLYPSGGPNATVLEEGISTYFSEIMVNEILPNDNYIERSVTKHYKYALSLVKPLMEMDPNVIKKLRIINPVLSKLNAEHFAQAGVNILNEAITSLLTPFKEIK